MLNSGAASHLGRPTLLRCMSLLEERGLIEACGLGPVPLLAHVRLTPAGFALIAATLSEARAHLAAPSWTKNNFPTVIGSD